MNRPFLAFDASLDREVVNRARCGWLRFVAASAYLLCAPGFAFLRQRSDFVLGWRAAAAAGAAVAEGSSAGATGSAGVPPLGSWMMLPELTSPATRTVLPMNDCLYGAAHLELDRHGPVVISLPENVDARYYSVTVMDAYFNNVAHLGPRWTGDHAQHHAVVPPGWDGQVPPGVSMIEAPTPSVALLNRVLVDYSAGDAARVRRWREDIRLSPLSSWPDTGAVVDDVAVDDLVHPDLHTTTEPGVLFAACLEHLRHNGTPREAGWLLAMVEQAGLDHPSGADEAAAVRAGVADAQRTVDACLTAWPRARGWMVPDPRLGLVNDDLVRSAAFQTFQLGANDIAEAAYFFGDTDDAGALLDGSGGAVYALRFAPGDLPPHLEGGFWSVTMYGADDNLLVANPIDRYSTRPTRPGFTGDADGGVTVVLAVALPAATPEPNWLPAPDRPFRLGLRVYYPGEAITQGTWMPPAPRLLTRPVVAPVGGAAPESPETRSP